MIRPGQKMEQLRRDRSILAVAIMLTVGAELFYFLVWGVYLFPGGNLWHKAAWTAASGVGMGAVIGAGVLFLVEGRLGGKSGLVGSATVFGAVAILCAFLCAGIDANLSYFGGEDRTTLFLLAGILPALFGAGLYGRILFHQKGENLDRAS